MDSTVAPRSVAELTRWLTEQVAGYLEWPVEDVRADASLAECGIDSMYALVLCGDIEDNLGVVLEAADAWECRTIDLLAGHVAGKLGLAA